jgi:gliding motility-associated-like protein
MKCLFVIILFSFLNNSLFAQDTWLKWAKQFKGGETGNFDRGHGIGVDANGNVYSAGIFTGTVDFDPGPGTFNLTASGGSNNDVYISKLDVFGNFLWAKQITGTATTVNTKSLALDKDFNVYVSGNFLMTADFDPGPNTFNLTANGSADAFVLKLTTNGAFVWAKQMGGLLTNTFSNSTATDSFGNIYFTGSYVGSVDFDPGPGIYTMTSIAGIGGDVFVCKLDTDGNFVWAGSMGGNQGDVGYGISVDAFDNMYVTGGYRNIADFDPGPAVFNQVALGLDDTFILKLDAAGNFVWVKSVGGFNLDWAYKAIADVSGNVYITGFYTVTADFDPGPAVYNLTTSGADGIFVLKLNIVGNFVWAKTMGGVINNNWGMDLALDATGNIYTTGFFIGPGDFDPGPGVFILNSDIVDIFISKLDNNGNFVWAKSMGAGDQDQGLSIAVDAFKNIYTTGHFGFTVDFDPEASTYFLTADVSDPYVQKLAQCNTTTFSTITDSACKSYTLNGQTYTLSGTYQQVIFNSSGCDSIITLNLNIYGGVSSTVNTIICPGQFYYAGGANQTTAGIYRDTLTTPLGCDSIIITNLSLYPKPNPNLGADRNLCMNEPITITPGTFNNYLWQDNSTQPNYTINNTGTYWVKVTDANNCSATDTLNIISIDTIPKNFLPADQDLCYGNVLKIAVPDYLSYLWSTGSTDDFIDVSTFGTYYLTVKDFNSCTGTDSITILRKNCIYMGIPNAFTPNGDNKNDIFKPEIFQAIKSFSFIVFNRYGQTVFETREYGKGWDGTLKGKPQPSGSYVYHIKYTNIFGVEIVENGSVLLIR